MVGNLSNSRDNSENTGPPLERVIHDVDGTQLTSERVLHNHNICPQALKDLIKGALEPLPTDPVPTSIELKKIIITRDSLGGLALSCEVWYETVE